MSKIFILSGEVGVGKTTALLKWIKDKHADGILAPVINNKRHLLHISSNQSKLLEVEIENENKKIVTVGKYLFDVEIFNWARKKLVESFNAKPEWLVVDEIGPLELNGKGLEPAVTEIINQIKIHSKIKIIFVVRKNLFNNFLNHYNLELNEVEFLEI